MKPILLVGEARGEVEARMDSTFVGPSAADRLYNRALTASGLPDCAEMRIVAAVTTSVMLWYLLVALS